MLRRFLPPLLFLWSGCASPTPSLCGSGADPIVVTGLNGVIDATIPAVEIVQLIPETCEERESTWMFWDDATSTASLGPEPTSGVLGRENIDVTDEAVFFRTFNVGVRLEYADSSRQQLRLVWFSTGPDLASVDCAAAPVLSCTVEAS